MSVKPIQPRTQDMPKEQHRPVRSEVVVRQEQKKRQTAKVMPQTKPDIQKLIDSMTEITRNFDKRLSYYFNKELNQIIVKVIDRNTDKVIKEIPAEDLQRVHKHIQKAIGLLFDERI